MSDRREPLYVWTIYQQTDATWLLIQWQVVPDRPSVAASWPDLTSLAEARALVPAGLARMHADPLDDSTVIESYL